MGPTTPIPNSANGGKLHAKPGRRPHHAAKNEGFAVFDTTTRRREAWKRQHGKILRTVVWAQG